ncbi:MAG: Uma2 family endonuclease [Acidobacteria bacterium]|nr:Uma2 family endonuclease [Acidobacteriota bacterium]
MSQPAVSALAPLDFELVYSDGEPLDSNWERIQMNLLIEVIHQAMAERGRTDFFAGGNMFVYYAYEQARDVATGRRYFRGPDVFYVGGVPGGDRKAWVAWEEGGRLPDLIVELLSPSTARIDRTVKKDLYAQAFRTPEYFLYDPATLALEGFRLARGGYRPLTANARGRLWSEQLGLELGLWQGVRLAVETTWVRLYDAEGRLIPTLEEAEHQRAEAERERADAEHERAETERERAETERRRAEAAEAELARLRARLGEV